MSPNKNHYVLIMAGGIGSRFWPVSKKSFPKQFIDIMGTGESLIKQTYNRFTHMVPKENIYVVTNTDYVPLVQAHIPEMHLNQILHEPLAKNTAPCIALANRHITQQNPDAVCLVAPSDHLISNEMAFIETAQHAMNFAAQHEALVTLHAAQGMVEGSSHLPSQPYSLRARLRRLLPAWPNLACRSLAKSMDILGLFLC